MFRPNKRKEKGNGNRFNFYAPQFVDQFTHCITGERFQHLAVGRDSFRRAESQLRRNRRRRLYRIQIVEFRPRLTADLNHIFKAGGCYQRCARAATLQQSIRAYGCAMHDFNVTHSAMIFFNDSGQARNDGARRIVGSGCEFENAQLVAGLIDKVSERAASIDADANRANFLVACLPHNLKQTSYRQRNRPLSRQVGVLTRAANYSH